MGPVIVKWLMMMAALAWERRIHGRLQKLPPPPPLSKTSPAPTVPLPDSAADLSEDNIEEVRIGAPPDPGSGTGQDLDAELAGDDYEGDEEEDDDVAEKMDSGGEETLDTTQHWTNEEAEAALTEVRKWIAWQGYVPPKQLV